MKAVYHTKHLFGCSLAGLELFYCTAIPRVLRRSSADTWETAGRHSGHSCLSGKDRRSENVTLQVLFSGDCVTTDPLARTEGTLLTYTLS